MSEQLGSCFGGGFDVTARPGMRARRLALGLDQGDLAVVLGVKQVTVSRWETGEREIPLGVLRELDALESAQDTLEELYLAGGDEPVECATEEEFWAEQPFLRGVPLAVQHVAVARAARRRAAKPKQGT